MSAAGGGHREILGRRLRALREDAGLAGKELAEALGWPASKISRLELARQNVSPADIDSWVQATDASQDERIALLGLLDQAREDLHTQRRRLRHGQAPMQAGYNTLVEQSTLIREFHTVVVPGLLQTRDYARAILTAAANQQDAPASDVEQAIATRMERQQFLYTHRRFEFLITEPVLRWKIARAPAMHAQLDRLYMAASLPNVRLGILPFDADLPFVPLHMFEMFDNLVCVETTSREHRHTGAEAEVYVKTFTALRRAALTGTDARRFIMDIATQLD